MPPIGSYTQLVSVNPDDGRPLGYAAYDYLVQPLRDLSPRIVVQKAAQVGATVLAILRAVWFLDTFQANSMYLFPTHRSAVRFSRGRFAVLLEQSPYLRRLFQDVKSAGHLRAGPVNFYCHGARSRTELMSTPVQYLTLDERDELYLGRFGTRAPWSAVELARQRLSGQQRAWELNVSTPTIPGHGIAAEFAASDQHFYHLRCPHCRRWVHPTWPDAVQWGAGNREWGTEHDAAAAVFQCQWCRRPWTRAERLVAIQDGQWVGRAPGRAVRGYHLSQLQSPAASAPRLVAQWRAAADHAPARQVFFNAVLGLPYLAEGARLDERFLRAAVERGGAAMALRSQGSVMGVDVGPTWLHVVIAEPVHDALRLIWIGKVPEWPHLAELIGRYRVEAFVIDAMPETHQARELLRTFRQGYLCYYRGPGGTLAVETDTHTLKAPRTESLDAMYLRWRTGRVIAPRDLPAEFVEHLTSLVRVVRLRRDGQPAADYLESGGPDHYAHALNYCELALALRGPPLRFEVTPPHSSETIAW